MVKITERNFEELVAKDETLAAKAKELTGEGEELKAKVRTFAEALGYELVSGAPQEISMDELEQVSGGPRTYDCNHEFVFVERVKGRVWGWDRIERCRKCGYERSVGEYED